MASAEERAYLEAENAMTNNQRKDGEEPVTTNLPQKRCEVQIQSYTPKSSVNESKTIELSQLRTCFKNGEKGNEIPEKHENTIENVETTKASQIEEENAQFERFLQNQRRSANAMMLPKPEVPIFSGDPIDYQTFVRAFENLIESNTESSSARLYYLIQYTRGDVQELMKSCLAMKSDEGYSEARLLLKRR